MILRSRLRFLSQSSLSFCITSCHPSCLGSMAGAGLAGSGLICYYCFGCQDQASNRSLLLQGWTSHLNWANDSSFNHKLDPFARLLLIPYPASEFFRRSITIEPSKPALKAIWRQVFLLRHGEHTWPVASSPVTPRRPATASKTLAKASPPMSDSSFYCGTVVLQHFRCGVSFPLFCSVAAPTLIASYTTQTLADASWSFFVKFWSCTSLEIW